MPENTDLIEIVGSLSSTQRRRVDRTKYLAMRDALLAVLPTGPPGITVAEAKAALLPRLSPQSFPGGEKAGWWLKGVQLDLEARGVVKRGADKPVRLYRDPTVALAAC